MKRLFTTLSLLSFILLLSPAYFAQAAVSDKADLSNKLTGRILLQVEDKGQAYYVDPVTKQRAYLGRPADAFQIMRELGLGISNANLAKIADPDENVADVKLAKSLAGRIVLQVEDKGQAYYINPADLKKYYLGKPADAFTVMRNQGLGITNSDLDKVPVFQKYKEKVEQLERKIEQIEGAGRVLGEEVKKQDEVIVKQREQIEDLKKRVEKLSKNQESAQSSLPPTVPSAPDILDTPSTPPIPDIPVTPAPAPTIPPSQTGVLEITLVNVTPDITVATIEWQTNKPTESKVFISGGNLSSKIFTSASGLSTRHSTNITGLSKETTYSYEIEAIAGGISSTKKQGGFKTLSPPPPLTPAISFSKEESGVANYLLKWEAKNADNCEIPKLGVYTANIKGIVEVTPLNSTTYTISCSGKGGVSSSSIALTNRYTVINKDNVSLSLQSLTSVHDLNICIQENNCALGADLFKLALTLPADSHSGLIQSLEVTLISELRDNYYLNQLRTKGFKEDRNSICTPQEQQSSQNSMCYLYFQVAPMVEYIDYIPAGPVVGEAIKKGTRFKFDKDLGDSFGPNEKLVLIFDTQPAATLATGQSGRIKLRIDKIGFRDGAYGGFDLIAQPIESGWVQLTK